MTTTTAAVLAPARAAVEVVCGTDPDPLGHICGALSRGDVPVVTDAGMPPAMRDRVVRAVEGRLAADGTGAAALPDEPLLALLTSGSTGAPRAVLRTLASWTGSHRKLDKAFGLRRDDVIWAPGSMASTLTLFAAHHARATGRRAVLSGPWRGVEAALPAGAADATVVEAVPPVVADVLDAVEAGLLPRLRTAVVAGSRVPAALRDRAESLGLRTVEYYGAAELSLVLIDGDPAPGADVCLRTCERGDGIGEIWVRSPYVALGYVEGEGPLRLDDGWATVGDLGRIGEDGTLELLGREGTTVSVGGHTVPVADVEAVLAAVPGVREVVCVGEPNERFGELLVAVVRPEPGSDPRPAIKAAAQEHLPHAAHPSRVLLVDDFPRTPGGKPARNSVRDHAIRC